MSDPTFATETQPHCAVDVWHMVNTPLLTLAFLGAAALRIWLAFWLAGGLLVVFAFAWAMHRFAWHRGAGGQA